MLCQRNIRANSSKRSLTCTEHNISLGKELSSIETPVWKYTPAEFDKLFRHAKKLEHEIEIIRYTGLVIEIPLQKNLFCWRVYTTRETTVSMSSAIMKELDLQSVHPEVKQQFKKRQQEQKKDWLERSFTAQHPNQTWVSDIAYFRVEGYWLYLCIILDLYSR